MISVGPATMLGWGHRCRRYASSPRVQHRHGGRMELGAVAGFAVTVHAPAIDVLIRREGARDEAADGDFTVGTAVVERGGLIPRGQHEISELSLVAVPPAVELVLCVHRALSVQPAMEDVAAVARRCLPARARWRDISQRHGGIADLGRPAPR